MFVWFTSDLECSSAVHFRSNLGESQCKQTGDKELNILERERDTWDLVRHIDVNL